MNAVSTANPALSRRNDRPFWVPYGWPSASCPGWRKWAAHAPPQTALMCVGQDSGSRCPGAHASSGGEWDGRWRPRTRCSPLRPHAEMLGTPTEKHDTSPPQPLCGNFRFAHRLSPGARTRRLCCELTPQLLAEHNGTAPNTCTSSLQREDFPATPLDFLPSHSVPTHPDSLAFARSSFCSIFFRFASLMAVAKFFSTKRKLYFAFR